MLDTAQTTPLDPTQPTPSRGPQTAAGLTAAQTGRTAHTAHTAQTAQTALQAAQAEFSPSGIYLNSASLGLPPARSLTDLQRAVTHWQAGTADPPSYDRYVERSRELYAALVGTAPERVAIGSQVSAFVGLIAAALPAGSEVLVVEGEFTSLVFPFLAQATRGVTVREVPLEDLAGSVSAATALVAVSAVQSADGRVADLDALVAACAAHGARTLVDTTQAAGWLPVQADRYDYTVGGGYKWLLAPRGTAYFTVRPDLADGLIPHAAGWYAGAKPWESIYGTPLRLSPEARRFDLSPAWHSWIGQAPALELLTEVGIETLHSHAVGLANRFRAGIGLGAGDSAIVSLAVTEGVPPALKAAGIAGAFRAGRLRVGFHLYNTAEDADAAAEVIRALVR
ncbi:aminotransferase class V-fold PLP-dependent enzyme [Nakamurella silvestris]|nr:aminotransferase class V-fold PLP-dependent enzyme [Nakamurella silvestris]